MASMERKAKNIKKTIEANCVDSTSSIPKILDYFQNNNFSAFQRYCRLVGRRTKSIYPHNLVPGHALNTFDEDWDGMLPPRYYEPFTYKCSLPRVLSQLNNIGCEDPVTGLMKKKVDWIDKKKNIINGIHISKLYKKFEKLNEDVACCPKHLITAAAELERDPEPHFNSCYNWYNAGHGNIHVICLNGKDYLLHSELNNLYFSEFSLEYLKIDYDHVFTFNCGEGNVILETVCAQQIIGLRLKTRVIILKIIIGLDTMSIEKLKEIETNVAYTGIAFDPHHESILYVTTLDNSLSIINIDVMKARTVKLPETESLEDNWSTVLGFDRNTYGHIGIKQIQLYDKRANNIIYTLKDPGKISDESCNSFSVAKKCEDAPLMYVGTNHHMFLMDLRYTGGYKLKMLQRWTHHMKCVPTYISLCKFEFDKDLVCLSSQWYEDTCIVPNDSQTFAKGVQTRSITMPYKPPTVEEALTMARKRQLCVDIYNPIETRLYTSITGNAVFEKDEKYHLLTQTSLGDIFCHTLFPDHMDMPEETGLETLHEWSKAIRGEGRIYEVSKVIDIADIWRNLKKVPRDFTVGGTKLFESEELKYSEQEVMDVYENDVLDAGLLDSWLDEKEQQTVSQDPLAVALHFSDSE